MAREAIQGEICNEIERVSIDRVNQLKRQCYGGTPIQKMIRECVVDTIGSEIQKECTSGDIKNLIHEQVKSQIQQILTEESTGDFTKIVESVTRELVPKEFLKLLGSLVREEG